jgi:hypothetical protein
MSQNPESMLLVRRALQILEKYPGLSAKPTNAGSIVPGTLR